MSDSLRTLADQRDKAHARQQKLTERPVLPPRGDAVKRRYCRSCWKPLNMTLARGNWLEANPAPIVKCCLNHVKCWLNTMPEPTACPECGGDLVEIVS